MRSILAGYLLLGLCYSLASPIFETPDEAQHFFFVRELAEQHGLPVQRDGTPGRWLQEGSQPPLYYLVGAVLTAWIDASDWQAFSARNPFAVEGDPQTPGNRNVYLHLAPEEFPWHGTVLAVHMLRLISLCLGALSVVVTYAIARLVFPGRRGLALGAAAIHAFLPQFLFISAAASNDVMAALACGAVLWQSLRVVRGASSRSDDILLGALVGLAALSKLSGASLALVAVVAVLQSPVRAAGTGRRVPHMLTRLLAVTVTAAVVAGWWYARNLLLYGDLTGLNHMLAIVGTRNPPPDFWQILDELEGLRLSFWGLFGWFSILMPAPFYWLLDGLAITATIGLLIGLLAARYMAHGTSLRAPAYPWRQAPLHPAWLPVLAAAIVFAGVVRWGIMTPGLTGRLLFPALSAFALLLSAGLAAWYELLEHRARRAARPAVAMLFGLYLLVAALVPFTVIAPAYARPALAAATPQTPSPLVKWTGAAQLELVGSEASSAPVHPGETLPLLFRWLTRQPVGVDYTLFIKVFGQEDELLASTDTYPGFGIFPTSIWPPNQVITDRYNLRVNPAAHVPVYAEVVVGFYDRVSGQSLVPVNAAGERMVRPVVARARILSAHAEGPTPTHLLSAAFGDEIGLRGYDMDSAGITLYWQALRKPAADYTVFVQALDQSGTVLAQADSRPRHGAYPTTVWEPGERVPDVHALAWPTQATRVAVGLYVLETGVRLPLADHSGDAVVIERPH